jgi:hypothetical protein
LNYNKFLISYDGKIERRRIYYLANEYSLYVEPYGSLIHYGLVINYLDLPVLDSKIFRVSGYFPRGSWLKANVNPPEFQQGQLQLAIELPERGFSYRIDENEWPVYFNEGSGWVCVGDPSNKSKGVEFVTNCVAILKDNGELSALWLKPEFKDTL